MATPTGLILQKAFDWRVKRGLVQDSAAVRVFHGPSEGQAGSQNFSIDFFAHHYWITGWDQIQPSSLNDTVDFLKSQNAKSISLLERPKGDLPPLVKALEGKPPEKITIEEPRMKFQIRLKNVRHPGLFLDHLPLRLWLQQNSKGLKVLNTFSYTGSLSVAAKVGGARQVTTLDLSGATIDWARENWALNGFSLEEDQFYSGDVFEWLPKWSKQGREFDMVILDPPSSSRGKRGHFSTSKNLVMLHEQAMKVLSNGGLLVTSINSQKISWEKFESEIQTAAQNLKMKFLIVKKIDFPETFPTQMLQPGQRYLKGFVLLRR